MDHATWPQGVGEAPILTAKVGIGFHPDMSLCLRAWNSLGIFE
jgi:hypothetical protein